MALPGSSTQSVDNPVHCLGKECARPGRIWACASWSGFEQWLDTRGFAGAVLVVMLIALVDHLEPLHYPVIDRTRREVALLIRRTGILTGQQTQGLVDVIHRPDMEQP